MDSTVYEHIDNQILRLLLYFGGVVIVALSSALTYLWGQWRSEQKERIAIDKATAQALTAVANEIDGLKEAVNEFRRHLFKK
jgi:hypothetical protein